MRPMLWTLLAAAIALGLIIGLAHTDAPTIQAPPLIPVQYPQYGERE